MAKKVTNSEGEINFEIGEWVAGDSGYGQLIFIREFHVEAFVELTSYSEINKSGVYKELFGMKLFCDFDWKVAKVHPVEFCSGIRKLKKKELVKVELTKDKHKTEYRNYIIYEEKSYSSYALTLEYLVDENCSVDYESLIDDVCSKLLPCFTFNEFKDECKSMGLDINLMDYLKYGAATNVAGTKLISIIFYSRNFSVVNKERIFTGVRAIVK